MEVYNPQDIAVELVNKYTDTELMLGIDRIEKVPDTQKGKIRLVGSEINDLIPGDIVYFDPGQSYPIKDLEIVVMHKSAILVIEKTNQKETSDYV